VATVSVAAENPWPQMGRLFVEKGRLTPAQLEDALSAQRRNGERLGEILVARGHISRIDLAAALSTQWSWQGDGEEPAGAPALEQVPPVVEERAAEAPAAVRRSESPLAVVAGFAPSPGEQDAHAALAGRVAALEEKLAAAEARLTALNERFEQDLHRTEELRRLLAEQAMRISAAARALFD